MSKKLDAEKERVRVLEKQINTLKIDKERIRVYEQLENMVGEVGGIPDFTFWKDHTLDEIICGLYPNGLRINFENYERPKKAKAYKREDMFFDDLN